MEESEFISFLTDMLGFAPDNVTYYRHAFMHSSCAGSNMKADYNNERLEFLGDSVLSTIVSEKLYLMYPDKQEGFLSMLRSKIVQRPTLNSLAAKLGLDKLVVIKSDVAVSHLNVYGNAFEALLGAVYLDKGFSACSSFMNDIVFAKYLNIERMQDLELNYKSRLLEWCQKFSLKLEFELVGEEMVNKNDHMFKYKVLVNDVLAGQGNGYSKKEAQQFASQEALNFVRRKPEVFGGVW